MDTKNFSITGNCTRLLPYSARLIQPKIVISGYCNLRLQDLTWSESSTMFCAAKQGSNSWDVRPLPTCPQSSAAETVTNERCHCRIARQGQGDQQVPGLGLQGDCLLRARQRPAVQGWLGRARQRL